MAPAGRLRALAAGTLWPLRRLEELGRMLRAPWLHRLGTWLLGPPAQRGAWPSGIRPRGPAGVVCGPAPLYCPHGELGACFLCAPAPPAVGGQRRSAR